MKRYYYEAEKKKDESELTAEIKEKLKESGKTVSRRRIGRCVTTIV